MTTLIDARLYLSEDWCLDEARCKKAAILKEAREFLSKFQLTLAMLEIARQRGIQFGYVGIDGGYGKEPAFLRGVEHKAAVLLRMCIVVKRFICKTLSRTRMVRAG
ncbi:transposase [Methylomonas sp. HYX-M1]|uniref:transposase n=1 Tax=Methylomonas sp. HYX-M1 TaxID=3139307 RepID=UPI00345BE142